MRIDNNDMCDRCEKQFDDGFESTFETEKGEVFKFKFCGKCCGQLIIQVLDTNGKITLQDLKDFKNEDLKRYQKLFKE